MIIPQTMKAVVTMGHGGFDQLVYHHEWPCPIPKENEVLIKVHACGLNNTDVNTRSGWYSKKVRDRTTGEAFDSIDLHDPTWGGNPIVFPRIQGADVCGEIVEVGNDIENKRIGERVITDNWIRDINNPEDKNKVGYFGSEFDGGFAEYAVIPSVNAITINSPLSSEELATFSCSYSTAEGMLTRANVDEKDTILVTGASGGVGSALVQLAKLHGARVIALASEIKHDDVTARGADRVLPRVPGHLKSALGDDKITVVADIVGGDYWPHLIDCLERGGRYTCSGAIAGPIVTLDLRTFYLRDLTFIGSTVIDQDVTPRLVRYIESGAIKPVLAATYPLENLQEAQSAFIAKKHTGNIVVCP